MNAHSSLRKRAARSGAALVTAGVLVALSVPSVASAAEGDTTIDVYDVNDFHGRIAQSLSTPPRSGDAAGAAVLAGALDQLRGDDPSTSAFVSAGDNIGASTFESFIQQDQPTIDVLNAMDLSVSAIGNHELDKGRADLQDRVIGPDDARNAQWDYVSANILDRATGEPAFDPYSIQEISGKRVGFIGATVDLTGLVSPDGIASLEMADITDSVNAVATDLLDGDAANGEADVLVLIVHDGAETAAASDLDGDSAFARAVHGVTPDVSAILSGHTHQTYVHDVVPDGGTVPRPVIQTGSYGFNLGHLQLTVAADGSVTATGEDIRLVDGTFAPDAGVAATVAAAVAEADVLGAVELGTTDVDMRRAVQTDGSENRGGESTLGNFVAEVQRTATADRQGSQIAFMNPGGLRADLLGGTVTYKEAALVQPFANTLVVLDLTGAQVEQALEQQWQPPSATGRPFLKLGVSDGFAYTYDPAAATGSRITSMTLDGAAIDPATTYKVTVNSFLASGGDNFTAFAGAAAKQDSGTVDLEAQVEYFETNRDVTVADDQRSVGATLTPTPAGGFQPGDRVSLALSSLLFSNAADQPTSVQVSAGDQVLATADIDPAVVDTTDEQGRATLAFDVPTAVAPAARAAADTTDEPLVVTVGATRIALPVTIPLAVAVDPTDPTDPGTPGGPGTDPTDPGTDPGAPGTPADPGAPGAPGVDPVVEDGAGPGAQGAPTAADGSLAYTGAELLAPAAAAGLLLLAGITAMVIARRRRLQR
ncbi:bifunctional metallophosphatase/5'-nucleotidase [Curtobacterium sp. VKM Ac-1395]|uniref:bifunctional metallophosphatase/5'-nucleotidase n=1 Tax=Curtobacterium sp. VKM Ac-1395 TaxID=2783815 RepID=UPI00188A9941|nr:bifunctional UDP-sugar hydrolase/5'-nucleotidase [Curtobacterium sp. VKM Ac-1395]MBF4591007.1 5'-nucleotidase C-terminal domain-containing protein [Curtobacterium sp. VKM Ac-1395]